MIYAFKTIAPVPTAKEFVDIILSQTQRKTPTVVHKGYKIARIRKFYLRKIKFTQENFHERLDAILNQFPKLDDIHPFYADLINVLYSRDHYKLALGQVSTARTLIDNIGKDYLKLLKFGDSLYRCKELKRAALGRMCTVTKKLSASLKYLESVRQHLARLPSIDPTTRTLLITGYPNVGKSSFINKISNANVEVQPYAFTTKSLFIGHFDYKYQRWQIIDTPGILDHPLEERNTIEMQAITALAHLQSSVLFLIDISEQCGYSLKQQISLFHSIKALFANKPLVIVANKIDVRPLSSLSSDEKAMINSMLDGRPASETKFLSMSNVSEEGIQQVMTEACEILLAHRVEKKLKTKKVNDIINRIQVTLPTPRDNRDRTASIPASVLTERTMLAQEKAGILNETDPVKLSERSSREGGFSFQLSTNHLSSSSSSAAEPKKKTMKDVEAELGGPGIFNVDFRGHWDLDNPEWRYDVIPEVMDGKNIVDFIDPDIEEKLAALEKEEEEQLEAWIAQKATEGEDEDEMDEEDEETLQELRNIKKTIHNNAILNHTNNRPQVPRKVKLLSRSTADATKDLAAMGVDTTKFASSIRARSRSRTKGMKRDRDETEMDVERLRQSKDDDQDGDDMAIEDSGRTRGRSRTARSVAVGSDDRAPSLTRSQSMARDRSRGRSKSRPGSETSFRNVRQKMQAEKLAKTVQRPFQRDARLGEGDRHVFDLKPKHLYSGKMTVGKLDRR